MSACILPQTEVCQQNNTWGLFFLEVVFALMFTITKKHVGAHFASYKKNYNLFTL